jgi:HK97 family phage major capsid protein
MSKEMKRLQEIEARKAEIRSLLQSDNDVDLDALKNELESLSNETRSIKERHELANSIQVGKVIARGVDPDEDEPKEDVADSAEYRSAYLKNLMGKELNDAEKRAMTTASNSVGAVVPTTTMNKIVEKLKQAGVILPLVTTLNIPSNVKLPVEDTTNDVAWVAEGGSNDVSDKIGYVELGANELIKTIEITAHVEAMSIDAFESFLISQLVKKAKIAIDNGIINGTGTNNLPKGVLSQVTPIETASNAGYAYDDIMSILAELPSGYKQNAKFVVSTKTLYNEIAKIKDDDNNPIFKMETDGRFEGKLCGYPVVTYDNLADGKVIFGDFEYYYFNFVKQFEIAKDTSVGFKTGKTCYRVLGIADGNVSLAEAFVVMGKKQ